MLEAINKGINAAKQSEKDHELISESVLDVDEVIPGSEEEIDDIIDVDSVPDEVYKRVDDALDKLIAREGYDDTDVEEMMEEDIDDEDGPSDAEIEAVVNEAANAWVDDEGIGHPNTAMRHGSSQHQPIFGDK